MAKRNRFDVLETPIELNRRLIKGILKSGDIVIDATCGNGHDSTFIAECIGKEGTLYCFDIQAEAIKNTQESLERLNNKPMYLMFKESHAKLELFVKTKVDCVFYNLGYLPTSDKTITTEATETIKSVQAAFKLLKPNGIISLMVYLTHDNQLEYQQIKNYLLSLNSNEVSIAETAFILRKSSPVLFIIEML